MNFRIEKNIKQRYDDLIQKYSFSRITIRVTTLIFARCIDAFSSIDLGTCGNHGSIRGQNRAASGALVCKSTNKVVLYFKAFNYTRMCSIAVLR